jgi:oxygen-independent coproporphyrinogen-3 oxidase
MIATGLYIHIPFCTRRCGYCDFNTFAGQSHLIPQYVDALCQELAWMGQKFQTSHSIDTIFFGGGTPSLVATGQFKKILETVNRHFSLEDGAEITLEANPGTVSALSLQELRGLGFNRISFGMQSAHPCDLIVLNRKHQFRDVLNAIEWSQKAGFQHINADLIFGIPGQTLERWQQTLRLAAQLGVDHLSLYSLTLEEGTLLDQWYQRGMVEVTDDDLTADMFEYAMDSLEDMGFTHYEISNWARNRQDGADARCQHNLNTWRYHPYLGIGAGAQGFIDGARTANMRMIPEYILKVVTPKGDWPAAESCELLTVWEQMQEYMMVGLRLTTEGVPRSEFRNRFGFDYGKLFTNQIEKLTSEGLLEWTTDKDRLRLTRKGIMLGNQVFLEFVGDEKPDLRRRHHRYGRCDLSDPRQAYAAQGQAH